MYQQTLHVFTDFETVLSHVYLGSIFRHYDSTALWKVKAYFSSLIKRSSRNTMVTRNLELGLFLSAGRSNMTTVLIGLPIMVNVNRIGGYESQATPEYSLSTDIVL